MTLPVTALDNNYGIAQCHLLGHPGCAFFVVLHNIITYLGHLNEPRAQCDKSAVCQTSSKGVPVIDVTFCTRRFFLEHADELGIGIFNVLSLDFWALGSEATLGVKRAGPSSP